MPWPLRPAAVAPPSLPRATMMAPPAPLRAAALAPPAPAAVSYSYCNCQISFKLLQRYCSNFLNLLYRVTIRPPMFNKLLVFY
jgi:hypothetical protein